MSKRGKPFRLPAQVGRDLSLEELRARYNAVVLCYGAESDRRLGVPGEVRRALESFALESHALHAVFCVL